MPGMCVIPQQVSKTPLIRNDPLIIFHMLSRELKRRLENMCISGTGIARRDKRLKGFWHFDTISGANLASYLILLVSSQLKLAEVVNSLDWRYFHAS